MSDKPNLRLVKPSSDSGEGEPSPKSPIRKVLEILPPAEQKGIKLAMFKLGSLPGIEEAQAQAREDLEEQQRNLNGEKK